MLFDKSVTIIDSNKIIDKKVETFHVDTMQELIKEYFDSNYNVKLEMQKYNTYYPELLVDRFNIIILLNNVFYSTMYITSNYNSFQLQQICDINELLKECRNNEIKYGLDAWFSHSSYYDVDEFLSNNKKLKR